MRTPLHGTRPPFTLPSNVVYFHDWRYVNHGGLRWVDANGARPPLFTLDPVPPLYYEYRDMPLGIELVAKPAQRTEPVIKAEETDIMIYAGSLLHDEGRYRLWYECWPGRDIGTDRIGEHDLLRYAESDNGMDWHFPELGLVEYEYDWKNYGVPDYISTPREAVSRRSGDCEDRAIVLASLLEAKNIPYDLRASLVHFWVDYPGKKASQSESENVAFIGKVDGKYRLKFPDFGQWRRYLAVGKKGGWDVMPTHRKTLMLSGWVLILFSGHLWSRRHKEPLRLSDESELPDELSENE